MAQLIKFSRAKCADIADSLEVLAVRITSQCADIPSITAHLLFHSLRTQLATFNRYIIDIGLTWFPWDLLLYGIYSSLFPLSHVTTVQYVL